MAEAAPPAVNITAEIQQRRDQCLFRVDRVLHRGTLYTSDPEYAREWIPVARAVFEAAAVKGVRITHGELLVTAREAPADWREMARKIGAAIRSQIQSGEPPVKPGASAPPEGPDSLRHRAQEVLDTQLNPALAAHGGYVEIVDSEGNDLYLTMGGGCQGCSSAMATMRQGVELAIREAVPEVGEIYDATDHAAGQSPYM